VMLMEVCRCSSHPLRNILRPGALVTRCSRCGGVRMDAESQPDILMENALQLGAGDELDTCAEYFRVPPRREGETDADLRERIEEGRDLPSWPITADDIARAEARALDVSQIAAATKREHDAKVEAAVRELVGAGVPLSEIVIEVWPDQRTVVRQRRVEEEFG
jgi:hypothetical protein